MLFCKGVEDWERGEEGLSRKRRVDRCMGLVVRRCTQCVVSEWARAIEEHEPLFLPPVFLKN